MTEPTMQGPQNFETCMCHFQDDNDGGAALNFLAFLLLIAFPYFEVHGHF